MNNTEKTMDKIIALCKNRGFIFAGSEIYGGLANTWDYGPLGTRLKNNVKDAWRKRFIQERRNSFEVDADILMNPRVWEASGHVASFADPLLDCKECKMRFRADNLIDDFDPDAHADGMTKEQMFQYIKDHHIPCPNCGKHNFTDIREFNLMFQTFRGVTNDAKSVIYLRPENAQGEYVNYPNVLRSMRTKLPFSIGQIGKAFRNEITPGNFTFRTIEFEQMEFQRISASTIMRSWPTTPRPPAISSSCSPPSAGARSTAPTTARTSTWAVTRSTAARSWSISIPSPPSATCPTSWRAPTGWTAPSLPCSARPTTKRSWTRKRTTCGWSCT